jgi:hypothetical protein
MGDVGDDFRALRAYNKERKEKYGIDCPGCAIKEPKRTPTRMLPGMKCKVCGYVDRRPSIPREAQP